MVKRVELKKKRIIIYFYFHPATYQTVLDIPLLILPQQFLRKFCAGQFDRVSVVSGIAKIGKTCLRSFKWHVQFFFVWEKNLLKIKF